MNVPFRLLDVFTEAPLAGNALCVVPSRHARSRFRPRAHVRFRSRCFPDPDRAVRLRPVEPTAAL